MDAAPLSHIAYCISHTAYCILLGDGTQFQIWYLLWRRGWLAADQGFGRIAATQEDTFEAVKDNVYNLLGTLAMALGSVQLDVLFSKFESCGAGGVSGDAHLTHLLNKLIESDTQARPLQFATPSYMLGLLIVASLGAR